MNVRTLQKTVLSYWKEQGRHTLPWRKTKDPYRILVSEVMLQQTQVDRVIPYYKKFLTQFPTVAALATAPRLDVLQAWSGLGYNRRAKFLHEMAKEVVARGGKMPKDFPALKALPGIGEYTAKAVRVFAHNEPEVLIETNVRTVIIHHLFSEKEKVSEREILEAATLLARGQDPRTWHAALMDYGTYLKKQHGNASRRSGVYTKQKAFKGSLREVRGAILKASLAGKRFAQVKKKFPDRFAAAHAALKKEGLL